MVPYYYYYYHCLLCQDAAHKMYPGTQKCKDQVNTNTQYNDTLSLSSEWRKWQRHYRVVKNVASVLAVVYVLLGRAVTEYG